MIRVERLPGNSGGRIVLLVSFFNGSLYLPDHAAAALQMYTKGLVQAERDSVTQQFRPSLP